MKSCVRPGNKASGYCCHKEHVLSLTAAVATGLLVQEWTPAHWTARGDNYCTVVQYQPVLMFIDVLYDMHTCLNDQHKPSQQNWDETCIIWEHVCISHLDCYSSYIYSSLQMTSIPQAVLATAVYELQRRAILSDRGGLIHISNEQVSRTFRHTRDVAWGVGLHRCFRTCWASQ